MTSYDISDFPKVLVIDTNDPNSTGIALVSPEDIRLHVESVRAQNIVEMIDRALKEAGWSPSQLRVIAVVTRDGSLTGQRIGNAVAATLSWLSGASLTQLVGNSAEDVATRIRNGEQFALRKTLHTN